MNPLSPSPAAPPLGTGNDNTLLSSGARLSETDSSTNNSSHNSLHRNTVNRFSAFATNHFKKMGMSTEFLAASLGANLNETSKATSPSNPTPTSANSYSSGNGPDQWESFVRSRSSYSFALLNTLGTDGKTATKLSVDSNTKPSPLKQSTSAKNINSPVQEPEDGFLKDIESKGFAGIWNHPITRCYFLMYLIHTDNANVYFFRQDALAFRQEFSAMPPNQRKVASVRIYNTYLSTKHATLPIKLGKRLETDGGVFAINAVRIGMDNPDAHLFDDVAYISLRTLQDIYDGVFSDPQEPRGSNVKDDDEISIETHESHLLFEESAFYQAMMNDLRGTKHLTTIQYKRAAERIMDMPAIYFEQESLSSKVLQSLEAIGIDAEPLRQKYGKPTSKRDTLSAMKITSTLRGRSMDELFQKPEPKAMQAMQFTSMLNASGDFSHTFVQYMSNDQRFCEYCYGKAVNWEDAQAMYRCESCGYYCHKLCRNAVNVSCAKASAILNIDHGTGEVQTEKLKKIEEKIQAIQKEIDIELKIRDGLDKMVKAKVHLAAGKSSKKGKDDADVASQLDRSNKKLEVLKHEYKKYKLQLDEAQKAIKVELFPSTENLIEGGDNGHGSHREVVKISSIDPNTKTELTKLFFVNEDTSVRKLMTSALPKFSLSGNLESYSLYYKSEHGDEVPLRFDDMLINSTINFSQSILSLRAKVEYEYYDLNAPIQTSQKDANVLNKKQQEVFDEIVETEEGYNTDIQAIVANFLVPFETINLLTKKDIDDLFSCIEEISSIHRDICQKISGKKSNQATLLAVLSLFDSKIDSFVNSYTPYCSNQDNARRTLNRLKNDPTFTRILTQCETDPKLRKLTLPDLLVKPMHRITRYPLLFKRLLSHTKPGTEHFIITDQIITKLERMVAEINESVRKNEAERRIHVIEENLDFNNICEPFKLANGPRELISEGTFTYIKKNSSGSMEILILLFTDLLLIVKVKKADQFQLMKPPIPFEAAVFLDRSDSEGGRKMFQIVHLQQEIHLMEASTAYNKNNWLVEAEALRMRFCSYYYEYEVTRGNFLKWNTSKNTNQNNNSIINDDLKRRNTSSTPNSGSSSYSKPKPVSTAITFQDVIKVPEPPPGNFPSPPSAGLKRASSVGHRFKPKASLEILTADQSQIMQKTNSNNSINIPSNITSRSGGSTESIPRDIQHSGGSNDSIHKTAAGAATGVAGGGRTSVNSARGGGEKEKTLRIKSARESYQRSGASSDMDLHRRVSEDNIPENSVSESSPKSAVSAASFTWAFPRKNGGGGSGTIRSKTRIDTLLLPAQHIQNKLGSAESAPSLTSATGNKGSAESNNNDIASILELSDNIIVESPTTAATANDVSDQQGVNVGTPRRISGRLYSISRDFKSRSQKSVEDVNAKISKLFM